MSLSYRTQFFFVLAIGILLVSPSLFVGMFADDYYHYFFINNPSFSEGDTNDTFILFRFVTEDLAFRDFAINSGGLPWWLDKDIRLILWRPIAEISHYFDYLVFSKNILLMHTHSLIWYAILIGCLYKFYSNISSNRSFALLALLVFVTSPFHAFAVSWLANRNAVMAGTFSLVCLNLYHNYYRSSQKTSSIYICLSLVVFLLSLLSAEIGITTLAFLFLYLLIICKEPIHRALIKSMPFVSVFLLWFITYKALGYGASGGSNFHYLDPINNAHRYLNALFENVPRAFAAQMTIFSAFFQDYHNKKYAIYIGLACLTVLSLILYYKKNRLLLYFFLCAVSSVAPISLTFFNAKNLIYVAMAIAPIIAMLIVCLWNSKSRMAKILSILIFIYHVILSGLLTIYASNLPRLLNSNMVKTAISLPDNINNKQLVFFGVPDAHMNLLYFFRFFEDQSLPLSSWNIVPEGIKAQIYRASANEFLITCPTGLLRNWEVARNYTTEEPFYIGDILNLHNARLQINSINDKGNPTEIALTFDINEDDNLIFYEWKNNRLEQFSLATNEVYKIQ